MTIKKYILTKNEVVDNLTSTLEDVPLSANQGRVLNAAKVSVAQGTEQAGKVLGIGSDGNVTPMNVPTPTIPDATTESKGIVQVGEGLTVENGVIKAGAAQSLYVPNILNTNNEGFAVGKVTFDIPQYKTTANTDTIKTSDYYNWTTIKGGNYYLTGYGSITPYAPFLTDTVYMYSITVSYSIQKTKSESYYYVQRPGFRAMRGKDNTTLASSEDNASGTLLVNIPLDWDFNTDYMYFQFKGYTKTGNDDPLSARIPSGQILISGGTSSSNVYYNPTLEA